MPTLLHVGCGQNPLPAWAGHFTETRLDINPAVFPDFVADMRCLGDIGTYDAVLCIHALEHLHARDVPVALNEFRRVLNPGGTAIVFVPDLEGVQATDDVLFESPAGPISGLDLIYGFRKSDNPFLQHKTGFVQSTLRQAIEDAGFSDVRVKRLANFDMMGVGVR